MAKARKNEQTQAQKLKAAALSKAASQYRAARSTFEAEVRRQLQGKLDELYAEVKVAARALRAERYPDGRNTIHSQIMQAYGTSDWNTVNLLLEGWDAPEFEETETPQWEYVVNPARQEGKFTLRWFDFPEHRVEETVTWVFRSLTDDGPINFINWDFDIPMSDPYIAYIASLADPNTPEWNDLEIPLKEFVYGNINKTLEGKAYA